MRIKPWALLLLALALSITESVAHDVVWPGNPTGFTPGEPLRIAFGSESLIQVMPVIGEPCIVAVNLDPLVSTLVKVEVVTENPGQQVDIRVTPLRAATNATEVAVIRGEWHATGSPDPDECTAVLPNRFAVTVQVLGGPPPLAVSGVNPQAAAAGGTVIITGNGFMGTTQLTFGGAPAVFEVLDDNTIRAVAPVNAPVGKLSVLTPAGAVTSAGPFVVLPELKLMPTMNGTMVQVMWNDRDYPFTLQQSASLINPNWSDVIRTFDHSVNLPIVNGLAFYRLSWMEIPLDDTDYNRDRLAVAQFYERDPIQYWATYGIPALARLSLLQADPQADPINPFRGFLQGFLTNRLIALLDSGDLPEVFATNVNKQLAAGAPITNAVVKTITDLVREHDATNCLDLFRTNCLQTNALSPVFKKVLTNSWSSNSWTGVAPGTNKLVFSTNQFTNTLGPKWIDTHGTHGFTTNSRPVRPPVRDTNTVTKVKWTNITSSTFTDTTYDGACASLAVGASLAKMGVIGDDSSAYFWNELSRLLGAQPGTLGAYSTDIAAFYETVGYGASAAYDGPIESAVEEAKKALDRGCDVQICYYNSDRTKGHTEFVTGITIDPANSSRATISTLSWGSGATVTYTGSASGGTFSGKSDGSLYRKSTETVSYLEQTGTARLHYFCKK